MNRTFWPARAFEDVPHASQLNDGLAEWVHEWFGDAATFAEPELVLAGDTAGFEWFTSHGSTAAGIAFPREYTDRLAARFPLVREDANLIQLHAADIVQHALAALCPGEGSDTALEIASDEADMAIDYVLVTIGNGDDSAEPIRLAIAADGYLGPPSADGRREVVDVADRAMSGTEVDVGVERKIEMNIDHLLNLTVDDFVPIGDLNDIGFEVSANGLRIAHGFIGHVDNQLAVVVER